MKTTGVYSPPPQKFGEFDATSVDTYANDRDWSLEESVREAMRIPGAYLGVNWNDNGLARDSEFAPFAFTIEQAREHPELKSVTDWHYDVQSEESGLPIKVVIGATVRMPDILTGYFRVPHNVARRPHLLRSFVHTDDGQGAIETSKERGELEPVDCYKVGDLLLLNERALHRRYPNFVAEPTTRNRVTLRRFQTAVV